MAAKLLSEVLISYKDITKAKIKERGVDHGYDLLELINSYVDLSPYFPKRMLRLFDRDAVFDIVKIALAEALIEDGISPVESGLLERRLKASHYALRKMLKRIESYAYIHRYTIKVFPKNDRKMNIVKQTKSGKTGLNILWKNHIGPRNKGIFFTVQSFLNHPTKGRTQLTRNECPEDMVLELIKNPRLHTKKGHY